MSGHCSKIHYILNKHLFKKYHNKGLTNVPYTKGLMETEDLKGLLTFDEPYIAYLLFSYKIVV